VCSAIGARQKFIKPHCPWQNGKVELGCVNDLGQVLG
jgi:hypothetical protein